MKYLVLTHHHMDHAGGLRAYLAQGASLVVGTSAGHHFGHVMAAPFTRTPDLPHRDLTKTPILEVADRSVIGYVEDARLGFVTDVWSPGATPLPDRLTPALAALEGK